MPHDLPENKLGQICKVKNIFSKNDIELLFTVLNNTLLFCDEQKCVVLHYTSVMYCTVQICSTVMYCTVELYCAALCSVLY